jgi:hypothetical protein
MSHRNDRRDDRIGGYPMSRDGAYLSPEVANSPVDLLSRAARIRQHARLFSGDAAEVRLEQFADELEARARLIIRPHEG